MDRGQRVESNYLKIGFYKDKMDFYEASVTTILSTRTCLAVDSFQEKSGDLGKIESY